MFYNRGTLKKLMNWCMCCCFIVVYASGAALTLLGVAVAARQSPHQPTIGWQYLPNATCLIQASFVLCAFRRVKGRLNLLHDSPLLKEHLR